MKKFAKITGAAVATVAVAAAFPALASAATYAYVAQSGEVNTVEANTAMEAIMVAPSIDENSGVLLLTQEFEDITDEEVSGV